MDIKSYIIKWNSRHPLDRFYRQKHNIVFNSDKHRSINQLDLLIQFIEDSLYHEVQDSVTEKKKKETQLKKGIWIETNQESVKEIEGLFDKLDISKFNQSSDKIQIK